jgi:hypothetical protein
MQWGIYQRTYLLDTGRQTYKTVCWYGIGQPIAPKASSSRCREYAVDRRMTFRLKLRSHAIDSHDFERTFDNTMKVMERRE